MNFCVAGTNKVVVGYDAKTSVVYLDRRASGNMSFSAEFPNIVYAPLKLTGDTIKFQVLLDQSSIEVFANDGERVLTSLIFPAANSLGFEVFSKNGETTLRTFQAWPLGSIWN
jgi:sucrose-6-phosphate hydrolase SacC (GH32 family)